MTTQPNKADGGRRARIAVLTGLAGAAMLVSAAAVYANGTLAWPVWLTVGVGVILVMLIWTDLSWLRLPDALTLPLIGVGLLHASLVRGSLPMALIGAGIAYGGIILLNRVWKHLRGEDGIGMGDAKFLAGAGAWLGPLALSPLLLIASGAGLAVVGVRRLLKSGRNFERYLPFGPFLILGFWIIWLFPDAFMVR